VGLLFYVNWAFCWAATWFADTTPLHHVLHCSGSSLSINHRLGIHSAVLQAWTVDKKGQDNDVDGHWSAHCAGFNQCPAKLSHTETDRTNSTSTEKQQFLSSLQKGGAKGKIKNIGSYKLRSKQTERKENERRKTKDEKCRAHHHRLQSMMIPSYSNPHPQPRPLTAVTSTTTILSSAKTPCSPLSNKRC
jgi:hypothetical protein